MNTWLPPLATGRIPSTGSRFLLAMGLMALIHLPLFFIMFLWVFVWWMFQVILLGIVLLLSPRFWVALLLMLGVSVVTLFIVYVPNSPAAAIMAGAFLIPLWLGFIVAYRPWKD